MAKGLRIPSSPFHLIFLIVIFTILLNGSDAKDWKKEAYPNPSKDTTSCGRRGVSSWICDPDEMLSYADTNTLEEILRNIALKTNSGCNDGDKPGYQIGVALMKKMSDHYGVSKEEQAREFAVYLHSSWGVGHSGCDDGALLLLSQQDRQIYISTGRVAMETLTADQIDIIIAEMKPLLRNKHYGAALHLATGRMGEVFSGKVLSSGSFAGFLLMATFVIIVVAIIMYSIYKQNQFAKCQEKLNRIEQERNAANLNKKYESKSCPICLEEFTHDKATRLLLCGHKYCEPCLTKWLESKATCPICRQSTSTDDQTQSTEADFLPELGFRLMILQQQYPSFITHNMIRHWTAGHYSGSFASDPMFHHARPMFSGGTPGSSGSGGGFGGGGCSGGGGSGGSW